MCIRTYIPRLVDVSQIDGIDNKKNHLLILDRNMFSISFVSRVALICNICFLLAWLTRYFNFLPKGDIESIVLVAGILLSVVANALANLLYAIVLLRRKPLSHFVPVWLALINFLFLILQLYLTLVR